MNRTIRSKMRLRPKDGAYVAEMMAYYAIAARKRPFLDPSWGKTKAQRQAMRAAREVKQSDPDAANLPVTPASSNP